MQLDRFVLARREAKKTLCHRERQPKNSKPVQANDAAFAALRADGSVVTWGADEEGGNSQEAV